MRSFMAVKSLFQAQRFVETSLSDELLDAQVAQYSIFLLFQRPNLHFTCPGLLYLHPAASFRLRIWTGQSLIHIFKILNLIFIIQLFEFLGVTECLVVLCPLLCHNSSGQRTLPAWHSPAKIFIQCWELCGAGHARVHLCSSGSEWRSNLSPTPVSLGHPISLDWRASLTRSPSQV